MDQSGIYGETNRSDNHLTVSMNYTNALDLDLKYSKILGFQIWKVTTDID